MSSNIIMWELIKQYNYYSTIILSKRKILTVALHLDWILKGTWVYLAFQWQKYKYLINNLLKMHLHTTALHILVFIRAVDQHWELFWSDLLSSVSKHKEHWVYHIGLSTSVGTNDAGKSLGGRHERKQNTWITCMNIHIITVFTNNRTLKSQRNFNPINVWVGRNSSKSVLNFKIEVDRCVFYGQ